MIGHAYNDMCKNNPGDFVRTDLSFFVVFAVLILFEADISKWWKNYSVRRDMENWRRRKRRMMMERTGLSTLS